MCQLNLHTGNTEDCAGFFCYPENGKKSMRMREQNLFLTAYLMVEHLNLYIK